MAARRPHVARNSVLSACGTIQEKFSSLKYPKTHHSKR